MDTVRVLEPIVPMEEIPGYRPLPELPTESGPILPVKVTTKALLDVTIQLVAAAQIKATEFEKEVIALRKENEELKVNNSRMLEGIIEVRDRITHLLDGCRPVI